MNILLKLVNKIKTILLNFLNKSTASYFLYKFFFKLDSEKRIKKIKSQKNLFIIEQTFKDLNVSWSFPSTLRERGRKYYLKGLEFRAKQIYEDYLLKNLEFEENDLVIDCGANLGDLYLYLTTLNIRINYFGIEPGKREFLALKYNTQNKYSLIKSKLFKLAFGKNNSKMNLFYSPSHADSSLIEPSNFETKYLIDVQTIDQFIKQNKIKGKKIKLLKLEAEGYEPEILQGCQNNLENIEYISADLGPERGLSNQCTIVEVTNFLICKDFKLIDFGYPRITALYKNNLFNH